MPAAAGRTAYLVEEVLAALAYGAFPRTTVTPSRWAQPRALAREATASSASARSTESTTSASSRASQAPRASAARA